MESIKKLFSISLSESLLLFAVFMAMWLSVTLPALQRLLGIDAYLKTIQIQRSGDDDIATMADALNHSQLAGDASVFVLWSLVGLILYFIFEAFAHFLYQTYDYVGVLRYFKRNRSQLELEAVTRLAVSVFASTAIVVIYFFSQRVLLPRFLTYLSVDTAINWSGMVIVTIATMGCLHLMVVMLRLALLRYRIFRYDYT